MSATTDNPLIQRPLHQQSMQSSPAALPPPHPQYSKQTLLNSNNNAFGNSSYPAHDATSNPNNPNLSGSKSSSNIDASGTNVVYHHIYESVAIHFNIQVFFEQLIMHICYPLFVWMSPNRFAQRYTNIQILPFSVNHFAPFTLLVMIISYVLMQLFASKDEAAVFSGSVWYPLYFFASHRLTIAAKYASLSAGEYAKFMNTRDPTILAQYEEQMLLLLAWNKVEIKPVTDFEIVASALRTGCQLERHQFILPSPFGSKSDETLVLSWKAFLLDKLGMLSCCEAH
jgi:uncharacterized membrane protein (DUF485 family)